MDEVLMHALSNVGVPAALCFYTLFEVNRNVKKLTDSIDKLDNDITHRVSRLEDTSKHNGEIIKELQFAVKELQRRISNDNP